jgi:hypothetical protein
MHNDDTTSDLTVCITGSMTDLSEDLLRDEVNSPVLRPEVDLPLEPCRLSELDAAAAAHRRT